MLEYQIQIKKQENLRSSCNIGRRLYLQTHVGTALTAIESDKMQYDKNIKEILADVQVLARIIKYTVKEVQELSIEDIMQCIDTQSIEIGAAPIEPGLTNFKKLETLQTEDYIPNEGYITFDIRVSFVYQKKQMKLIINIEAQKSTDVHKLQYHLENRMIYYLSRLISSQKQTEFFHSDYDDIRKVYSIWICMDAKEDEDSIDKVELKPTNLYGKAFRFEELDKLCGIIIRIRRDRGLKESKNKLIAMLEDILAKENSTVKKNRLEMKYGLKMTSEMQRRIDGMCNLSDAILEQGLERGIATVILRMLQNGKAPEEIAELTGYDISYIRQIHHQNTIEAK